MSCSRCRGAEDVFDAKTARTDLKRYRRRGANNTTRILLRALKPDVRPGATVLDIGGGVGAIQHELLAAGAASAIHVDASAAYLAAAREEAARRGHEDRVRQLHGDFAELAAEVAPADIVTLDRVVCCYPDVHRLIQLSAERAEHWYGLSYPRATWWVRAGVAAANLIFRLRRNPFRVWLHPAETIDRLVRGAGLQPHQHRRTILWNVAVYKR